MLKRLATWFRARGGTKAGRVARLAVEPLEGRAVPASFTATTVTELIADINAANLTLEADTVTLAAGTTFTLTAVNNTTYGPTGLPTVKAAGGLTILGNGSVIERSSAAGVPAFRHFAVEGGASLTLQRLTLQGGLALGGSGSGVGHGGAIMNQGALSLDGVTVRGNTARGGDGYAFMQNNTVGGDAFGGGIYSTGTLVLQDCLIEDNRAIGGQGGSGAPGPSGSGGNAYGGGICTTGPLTVRDTTIIGNTATGGPGGKGGKKGPGFGGGIAILADAIAGLDTFSLSHCRHNRASYSGDDILGPYELID